MNENKTYRFVGISGSLRKGSFNTMALHTAIKVAPPNILIEQLDIHEVPFYNHDVHAKEFPAIVNELTKKIKESDGVLFVSPEYNYSIPGVLKNTIDILSRHPDKPFDNKAVAIMGASPGMLGTARMQYHFRQVMVFLNAWTVNRPEVMIAKANEKFDAEGNLTDVPTSDIIRKLVIALAELSDMLKTK